MVTNSLRHKNGMRTCQALANSRARQNGVDIIVVGSLPADAVAALKASGLKLEVRHNISDAQLSQLYSQCLFLLAPSLDEGHDLPIAEVLALHGNVLCSDIPAHREFYGSNVKYFDPINVEQITSAIDDALEYDGPWFPEAFLPTRSFADVAGDYRRLFSSIR